NQIAKLNDQIAQLSGTEEDKKKNEALIDDYKAKIHAKYNDIDHLQAKITNALLGQNVIISLETPSKVVTDESLLDFWKAIVEISQNDVDVQQGSFINLSTNWLGMEE